MVVVVIPAWEPDGRLVSLVDELLGLGLGGILVVDDGSLGAAGVFEALRLREAVRVVRLEHNRGKGRGAEDRDGDGAACDAGGSGGGDGGCGWTAYGGGYCAGGVGVG